MADPIKKSQRWNYRGIRDDSGELVHYVAAKAREDALLDALQEILIASEDTCWTSGARRRKTVEAKVRDVIAEIERTQ